MYLLFWIQSPSDFEDFMFDKRKHRATVSAKTVLELMRNDKRLLAEIEHAAREVFRVPVPGVFEPRRPIGVYGHLEVVNWSDAAPGERHLWRRGEAEAW